MGDIDADVCLLTLKFVPDWFVMREMLEKLIEVIFSNNHTDFNFIDPDIVRFFSDNINILSVDLNNISLDGVSFDKNEPKTIIRVSYVAWRNRFKQCKSFEKNQTNN